MTNTLIPGSDAGASTPQEVQVTEAIAGIFRVACRGYTIGYVQVTGQRHVALLGPVYNTSVEVAQTLTFDSAVRRLLTV
jgi:hypothetical protein